MSRLFFLYQQQARPLRLLHPLHSHFRRPLRLLRHRPPMYCQRPIAFWCKLFW
jgi:hypothetical protein